MRNEEVFRKFGITWEWARLQRGTMSERMESNRKRGNQTPLPTMFQFFTQLIFSNNAFCEY